MSSTILKAFGKNEWVAQNENEYVNIAVRLAHDVEKRKFLRATQRTMMADSTLCNAKELSRVLEDAFKSMFEKWMEKRKGIKCESGTI